ncbi:MAG: ATP-dependent DNA helicase, partial [Atopobiaceae bacterium]|nr:ATP-dependent DNA helicase [Atopobiaceae bacterium]
LDEAAKDASETVEALADLSPQLGGDLKEAAGFLVELRDALSLIEAGEDHTYVYSARLSRRRRDMATEALLAEKVDVGTDLAQRWLPEMMSVIFTSATIAVGESFEHFDHAVGLDQIEKNNRGSLKLASSFDFDHNMSVLVCRDMPAPGTRTYLPALVDLLFDVHRAMGGSVLTLFTNRREMEQVHSELAPRLSAVGLEVDCQERGSSPRRLREKFMADESRSLMALKSFWEGFDAAGDTLRCVVIPKLPFANPNDPLVRERDLREDRSWWRYSLPEAVLSVKQAAGRLIRTGTDAGIVVFADSRVATKRYGQQFVRSMPSTSCMQLDCQNVGRYIDMWRSSRKR